MGLAEAREKGKPAVIVFSKKGYDGPATFKSENLRRALNKSGTIPIRVLDPSSARPAAGVPEDAGAVQKYAETMKKYGVTGSPAMAFVTSRGAVFKRLTSPSEAEVLRVLSGIEGLIKEFERSRDGPGAK
ncbi:MAG: hypothetical protein ACYTGB_08785 [Planctomycetota bacterium]